MKNYLASILWAIMIFIIIAIPGNYIPRAHGFWELLSPDKIVHLAMFTPLAFLLARDQNRKSGNIKTALWVSLIFGIIYAILTELLQFFVIPGRNGNIYDAIADIIGVLLGIFLFYRITKNSGTK